MQPVFRLVFVVEQDEDEVENLRAKTWKIMRRSSSRRYIVSRRKPVGYKIIDRILHDDI